jgi:hemerythrin-like domain-containing protein
MKSTNELRKEHQGIELMLRVLRAVSDKLGRAEPIPAEDLDGIIEFLSVFVDKCHHGKEEQFLFPALEAEGVQGEGGLIGVMSAEHEVGRRLVANVEKAAEQYSGTGESAAGLRSAIREYVILLTEHIKKENDVLFALADIKLDPGRDEAIFESFEQLERDRIGPGKHEEFHALLNRLEQKYLR